MPSDHLGVSPVMHWNLPNEDAMREGGTLNHYYIKVMYLRNATRKSRILIHLSPTCGRQQKAPSEILVT